MLCIFVKQIFHGQFFNVVNNYRVAYKRHMTIHFVNIYRRGLKRSCVFKNRQRNLIRVSGCNLIKCVFLY